MIYAIEVVSGCMIYLQNPMKIGSGIRVILRVIPQQFEGL
jgi:hypothetical protein